MLILVLGDSDTEGAGSGGLNWPGVLVERLADAGVADARLEAARFTAVPPGSEAYARRRVEQHRPDIVIIPVSAWGFTSEFVEYRVQRLLGKRAAKVYKRWESRFDRATRKRGTEPARANRAGRGIVRRVIGTAPQIGAGELATHYEEVFRTLARFEDTRILAMMYPGLTRDTLPPAVRGTRDAFAARIKKAAEHHRFGWLNLAEVFPSGEAIRTFAADDLHLNAEGHWLIAEAMFAKVRPLV